MIPDEVIAEIKKRADIGAIIGRTVRLKKTGRNLVGLCPFHTEKTPSFNVRPDEGFYYCFGCKAAGDVVEFLVRTTGRGFLDVVTELAADTGVLLPERQMSPEEETRYKEKKRLLRACELAQVFFRTRLSSEQGKAARAYLSDVRKLDDETVDRFGLGFGGGTDDGLLVFLKEQGVSAEDGVAAGVLAPSSTPDRPPYDFYRHRVTIPIRGAKGEVIAFGGRIFGDREVDAQGHKRPKYINGPQTRLYDKSAVLYGLFEAQPALKQKKPAVLVEGYFDAIAVHKAGVPTAVAPCGTSLTPRHIDELKKRTEQVVVCLDADPAGREAAVRAVLMLLIAGVDARVVGLPDKDPDSLVQAGRADDLRALLLSAPSAIDVALNRARERARGSVSARMQALTELLPVLAAPSDELMRAEGIRAAARAFNEDEELLRSQVAQKGKRMLHERLRGSGSGRSSSGGAPSSTTTSSSSSSSSSSASSSSGPRLLSAPARRDDDADEAPPRALARTRSARPSRPFSTAEYGLATALLCHPQLAPLCTVLGHALEHDELRQFVATLVDMLVRFHDRDPRAVLHMVPVKRGGEIARVMLEVHQTGGFADSGAYLTEAAARAAIEDVLIGLDRAHLEQRLGEIASGLAAADERADDDARRTLLAEQKALVAAIRALDGPASPGSAGGRAAPAPATAAAVGRVLEAIVEPHPTAHPDEAGLSGGADRPTAAHDDPHADAAIDDDPPEPPAPDAVPYAGDPEDDPWAG